MINNKFDAIIFGNGMTINLLQQLKPYIDNKKLYLLDIDEFLKRFISNKLSPREEQRIFNVFYHKKNINNIKYFDKLKYELDKYYLNNNANIEKILGRDLFGSEEYDIKIIKELFPALYNIWFDILYNYIVYVGLEKYISAFYESIKAVMTNSDNIYTTNFDYGSDNYLNPKHLHGKFIKNISKYRDIKLRDRNNREFYFKCIWGWNGIGKFEFIKEINKLDDNSKKYFNFDFFYDKNIKINNLLVYGLSFQRSGFIDDLQKKYPKYKTNTSTGSVIDEHILKRIKELQNLEKLKNISISYYSEHEKEYFKLLFEYYKINNVEFVHASELDFKIK